MENRFTTIFYQTKPRLKRGTAFYKKNMKTGNMVVATGNSESNYQKTLKEINLP